MSWLFDAWRRLLVPSELSGPDPVYAEWASQTGHVLLGLLTAGAVLRHGGDAWDALGFTAALWCAWEAAQVLRSWGAPHPMALLRGALVDLAHDGAGALLALWLVAGWSPWLGAVAAVAALLWAGRRVAT